MTAINIIKQRDRVHLITDGLVHGATAVMSKVFTLPHLGVAIACTGAAGAGIMIAAEANQATSYDDLRENIGKLMRHCESVHGDQMRTKAEPDYEIFVAGISETIGPDDYMAVSHKRRPGVSPYTAVSRGGSVQIQPCTAAIMSHVLAPWHGRPVEDLDPIEEAPRIIEIQRKHLNGQYRDTIGGLCVVTTIAPGSITQTVAKRWPLHLGWEG